MLEACPVPAIRYGVKHFSGVVLLIGFRLPFMVSEGTPTFSQSNRDPEHDVKHRNPSRGVPCIGHLPTRVLV